MHLLRQVACGMDFTVWMCNQRLWSAGNPQYGQLGHGTDHEYNARDCERPFAAAFPSESPLSPTFASPTA